MTNVVCYYRHSTDNKQQDANSIERQQRECRQYAKLHNFTIIEEVKDKGESGTKDKENLEALKEKVKQGYRFDGLLIDDQSRLTRKTLFKMLEDIGFLEEAGIGLILVNKNHSEPIPVDELCRDIRFIVDGWKSHEEVRDAARRSVAGMRTKFEEGRLSPMGRVPLGFDKLNPEYDPSKSAKEQPPRSLVANSDLKYVTQIFETVLAGGTLASCVRILEKTGRFKNATDKNPSATSVRHILRNPIYCGIRAFGFRQKKDAWETANPNGLKTNQPINVLDNCATFHDYDVEKAVTKEQFLQVQKILDSNSYKSKGAPASADHRYTGLLKCADCGGAIVAHRRRWKKKGVDQGFIVDWYCAASTKAGRKCKQEKPCRKGFTEAEADQHIQNFFATQAVFNSGFHRSMVEYVLKFMKLNAEQTDSDTEEQLAQVEIEEKKVQKIFESMDDVPSWVYRKIADLQTKRLELEAKDKEEFTIADSAKEAFELVKRGASEIHLRYLSKMWEISKRIISSTEDLTHKEWISITKEIIDDVFLHPKKGSSVSFVVDQDDQIVGLSLDSVDDTLRVLEAMGLQNIHVAWRLGEHRGKPKRVIDSLSFNFIWANSVTAMESSLRGIFHTSNHQLDLEFQSGPRIGK